MNESTDASTTLPLRHCYWVIPGLLLAGEHPGGQTRDKTKDRLKKLQGAGIECFLDLTKPTELARYDTFLPFDAEYSRKPIKDHSLPASREQMVEILDTVGNWMRAGRPAYIHCRAGIGRTGTVVGCFLVERGLAGDGALDELNRLWQQSKRSKTWAFVPETEAQATYVREWRPSLNGSVLNLAVPAGHAADSLSPRFDTVGLTGVASRISAAKAGKGAKAAEAPPVRSSPRSPGAKGVARPDAASGRSWPAEGRIWPAEHGGGGTRLGGTTGKKWPIETGRGTLPVDAGSASRSAVADSAAARPGRAGGKKWPIEAARTPLSVDRDGLPVPQRAAGAGGATGVDGAASVDGAAGVSGAVGVSGVDGAAGASGATGTNEMDGAEGASWLADLPVPPVPKRPAATGSAAVASAAQVSVEEEGPDPLLDPGTLDMARAMRERFVGALLGLAVGDSVAAATQYRRPGTFTPVGDMIGGGPFELPRGAWSDDTSIALCLAESLLECAGFDPRDQVQRYTRWQQEGYLSATGQCLGITASTARSLAMAKWRRVVFPGSHDPDQLDPEPLTRIAPIALYYLASLEMAEQQAAEASRTTCQAPAVLDACRHLGRVMHAAVSGQPKARILAQGIAVTESAARANSTAAAALEAALWAFGSTGSFREAVLRAANVGGNSDVVASVCGQLAGAHYGFSAIPVGWRNGLMHKDLIESYADRLLAHALVSLSG